MVGKILVGQFERKTFKGNSLSHWMESSLALVLGYMLILHVLIQGWICFILWSEEDCENIKSLAWNSGPRGSPYMIGLWTLILLEPQ
jgi:hypothetical protein